jgi:SulP family sulfate permease
VLLGLSSLILLLAGRRWWPRLPMPLMVVFLGTLTVVFLGLDQEGVKIVGAVPAGLPHPALPRAPAEVVWALFPAALTIAFIGFLESIAVARSLAAREAERVDANRELVGLGFANLVAGVLTAFPVTGGFSRSAVNYQAGARSGLASVVTAILVMVTLMALTPLFYHLPQAILASLVMAAVVGLVDFQEPLRLWRVRPADALSLGVTFLATFLLGVETGILVGVAFSLAIFLWRSAFPHVAVMGRIARSEASGACGVWRNVLRHPQARPHPRLVVLRPDSSLYFANATWLRDVVERALTERKEVRGLVIDLSAVNDVDAIALESLEELMHELDLQGQEVHLAAMKGPVAAVAARAGWRERYADRAYHLTLDQAVAAAEAALARREKRQA